MVVSFAGLCWPYGPERLIVRGSPREGQRSLLRAGDHSLFVDPSLPAPTHSEGPLSAEAAALRAALPAQALEIVFEGPRPPQPGADVAALVALGEVLGASPDGSPASAVQRGVPIDASSGAPREVQPELLAWCEASLLLARDSVGSPEPPCPEPAPGLLSAQSPRDWAAAVSGQGLSDPRNPRERDLFGVLRAAGLLARWSLPRGALLLLTDDDSREALTLALSDHGFVLWPMTLQGLQGLDSAEAGGS